MKNPNKSRYASRVLFIGLILTSTLLNSEPVIDIHQIVGKSKEEVSEIFGAPESSSTTKYGAK